MRTAVPLCFRPPRLALLVRELQHVAVPRVGQHKRACLSSSACVRHGVGPAKDSGAASTI